MFVLFTQCIVIGINRLTATANRVNAIAQTTTSFSQLINKAISYGSNGIHSFKVYTKLYLVEFRIHVKVFQEVPSICHHLSTIALTSIFCPVHLTYIQTETTLVCISDCCVVKVGVVFSVVDNFQCRSGILSGFNLNLVFLPKL